MNHINTATSHVIPEEQASAHDPASLQGDILIDINDRFPRDFLSEIFSKAVLEDNSAEHPYFHDGAAVSMNVHNHDPKSWSYFQQLDEEQSSQADVASNDQAESRFPADLKDGAESSRMHHVTPLSRDGNPTNLTGSKRDVIGTSTIPSAPEDEQMKVTESEEFSAMVENIRTPVFELKNEKTEIRHAAGPPLSWLRV